MFVERDPHSGCHCLLKSDPVKGSIARQYKSLPCTRRTQSTVATIVTGQPPILCCCLPAHLPLAVPSCELRPDEKSVSALIICLPTCPLALAQFPLCTLRVQPIKTLPLCVKKFFLHDLQPSRKKTKSCRLK